MLSQKERNNIAEVYYDYCAVRKFPANAEALEEHARDVFNSLQGIISRVIACFKPLDSDKQYEPVKSAACASRLAVRRGKATVLTVPLTPGLPVVAEGSDEAYGDFVAEGLRSLTGLPSQGGGSVFDAVQWEMTLLPEDGKDFASLMVGLAALCSAISSNILEPLIHPLQSLLLGILADNTCPEKRSDRGRSLASIGFLARAWPAIRWRKSLRSTTEGRAVLSLEGCSVVSQVLLVSEPSEAFPGEYADVRSRLHAFSRVALSSVKKKVPTEEGVCLEYPALPIVSVLLLNVLGRLRSEYGIQPAAIAFEAFESLQEMAAIAKADTIERLEEWDSHQTGTYAVPLGPVYIPLLKEVDSSEPLEVMAVVKSACESMGHYGSWPAARGDCAGILLLRVDATIDKKYKGELGFSIEGIGTLTNIAVFLDEQQGPELPAGVVRLEMTVSERAHRDVLYIETAHDTVTVATGLTMNSLATWGEARVAANDYRTEAEIDLPSGFLLGFWVSFYDVFVGSWLDKMTGWHTSDIMLEYWKGKADVVLGKLESEGGDTLLSKLRLNTPFGFAWSNLSPLLETASFWPPYWATGAEYVGRTLAIYGRPGGAASLLDLIDRPPFARLVVGGTAGEVFVPLGAEESVQNAGAAVSFHSHTGGITLRLKQCSAQVAVMPLRIPRSIFVQAESWVPLNMVEEPRGEDPLSVYASLLLGKASPSAAGDSGDALVLLPEEGGKSLQACVFLKSQTDSPAGVAESTCLFLSAWLDDSRWHVELRNAGNVLFREGTTEAELFEKGRVFVECPGQELGTFDVGPEDAATKNGLLPTVKCGVEVVWIEGASSLRWTWFPAADPGDVVILDGFYRTPTAVAAEVLLRSTHNSSSPGTVYVAKVPGEAQFLLASAPGGTLVSKGVLLNGVGEDLSTGRFLLSALWVPLSGVKYSPGYALEYYRVPRARNELELAAYRPPVNAWDSAAPPMGSVETVSLTARPSASFVLTPIPAVGIDVAQLAQEPDTFSVGISTNGKKG